MRKAGVTDYESFARDILRAIPDRLISFEVFVDEFAEMERQARKIAIWGKNVAVKIPITNTQRESAIPLVKRLLYDGIPLNVTAIFTLDQDQSVVDAVTGGAPAYVSVFAGRIADTGADAVPLMAKAPPCCRAERQAHLGEPTRTSQYFSSRYDPLSCNHRNQRNPQKAVADRQGSHRLSPETVAMFYQDGRAAGFAL